MSVGNPRGHLEIEGPQDSLVPANVGAPTHNGAPMDAVHPKNPLQPADQRPPRDAPRGRRGIPTHSAAPTPATRRQPTTGPPHTRANSPPPPWKRYTPATHRHSPPAGTAPGPQHAQAAATHRPADPANAIPHTTGPTQRQADTPKHHMTTPPWLRHSSPAHPAPGDPRPHATPTPHRPRTETRQEDDQETTRGCPTPPEERTRTSSSELISLGAPYTQNHSSRSILMVSSLVMCLVHGNSLVNLVRPQVTTRAKS